MAPARADDEIFRFESGEGRREDPLKAAPKQDIYAQRIAEFIARVTGNKRIGYKIGHRPAWLKKQPAFKWWFFDETKDYKTSAIIAIDVFDFPDSEIARPETMRNMEAEIAEKAKMCRTRNLKYMAVRPEDELTGMHIEAMLGGIGVKSKNAITQSGESEQEDS